MCDQQSLRSACAYGQTDQSLWSSLEFSKSVKLLSEHYLEFLSLKVGCTGSSESTIVKMPHCWKSHVTAQIKEASEMSEMSDSKSSDQTVRMSVMSVIYHQLYEHE